MGNKMLLRKILVVAFMIGLVFITVIMTGFWFIQYQQINQLTIELEQLTTELNQLKTENEQLEAATLVTLETLPTVRATNGNYNESTLILKFWGGPEWEAVSNKTVVWGSENLLKFINIATLKAKILKLNSTELFQILLNLSSTEMVNHDVIAIPCLVEKAKFKDADAWIIVFNWEINIVIENITLSHIMIYVIECETQTVLDFESCL
jgi:hypothetical protein